MAAIELEHITKRYPDGTEAVADLNLKIDDGEFVILVGPSGCGKSTALRMIAGLEDITEGELRIGDQVVNEKAPKERDIAMVFQNYALYPHMTVRDNMGFALKLAKVDKEEINRRVGEAARILDLEQHLDRKPANLSGGQRQRVAMGRAIVRDPSAFLRDEPLSNLDAKLRVQTRAEVARLQDRLGTTMVYVTHDQTEALTLGDRVAVMRAGILQQVDSPKVLYENPVNLFVAGFIGSPAMNFFPASIESGRVRFALGAFDLPGPLPNVPGGELLLGIRPEDFEDAELIGDKPGHRFEADISLVEPLGSDPFPPNAYGRRGAQSEELAELAAGAGGAALPTSEENEAVLRLEPASSIQAGSKGRFWMDTSKVHLFDPKSGESLTA